MKITWITRSFLDYRIPVFRELNHLTNGGLTVLYYGQVVPERVTMKTRSILGDHAIALCGEWRLIGKRKMGEGFANSGLRIPYQPGLVRAARLSYPDVLVSDGFFQWTYSALWLRATGNVPHVMCYERTCHTERNAQWYRTAYRRLAMRWIDAMCCNGTLCAEYAQHLGFPGDRITFGHMVADVEGLRRQAEKVTAEEVREFRSRLSISGLVFLYVGRLIRLKGLQELLFAWSRFCETVESDKVTLLVVGDGPERTNLERQCEQDGLSNVRFVGAVDYDELVSFYRSADVFAMPTLEDNWSLVVPEAMACGLPILCSKYNGCWPEYVTPSNGWVFDPLNVEDTLRGLRKCFLEKERLRRMGIRSTEIIGNHTAREAAKAVLDACRVALERSKRRHGQENAIS